MSTVACAIAGCENPGPYRKGYCNTHRMRLARGGPMGKAVVRRLSPFSRYVEACISLADSDSQDDEAYQLALDRARKATKRWMRSLGWRPASETVPLRPQSRRRGCGS